MAPPSSARVDLHAKRDKSCREEAALHRATGGGCISEGFPCILRAKLCTPLVAGRPVPSRSVRDQWAARNFEGETMRINVEVDEKLLMKSLQLTGLPTYRAALNEALTALVGLYEQGEVRGLRG